MNDSSDPKRDPAREQASASDEEFPVLADFLRNNADVPSDAHSSRDDCFGPPQAPVECFCLHCGHIYMSDLLLAIDVDGTTHYACPVKDCDGMGYKFDIFPVNDDDEEGGWVECDDDAEFEDDESEFDEVGSEFEDTLDPNGDIPFDPPHDWSPDADAEDEFSSEEEEPRYFTRDDYDALKAAGEYDRRAEEIRTWWRQCEADRKDPTSPKFGDDDIPF
jgi:hypothetical protein